MTEEDKLKKVSTSELANSDTVQLKLIKEKKKKLSNILTASQTIRLQAPKKTDIKAQIAPDDAKNNLDDEATKELKIKTKDDKSSLSLQKDKESSDSLTDATSSMSTATAPLKIKDDATSSMSTATSPLKIKDNSSDSSKLKLEPSTSTLKIKSITDTDSGVLKIEDSADVNDVSTLKIKKVSNTLKIKSQEESPTLKIKDSSVETLKIKNESPTLKIKKTTHSNLESELDTKTNIRQNSNSFKVSPNKSANISNTKEEYNKADNPGVLALLSNLVVLSVFICVLVFLIMQYKDFYLQK